MTWRCIKAARELLKVWTVSTTYQASYGYDCIGNTAMVKRDGSWWYAYDGAGNRTVRAKAARENADGSIRVDTTKEYWEYEWDLHNRLIHVEQKGIATTGTDVSYAYDARNQRVRRAGKDGTTVYAYGRQGALAWQKNEGTGGGAALERMYAYLGGTIVGWTERKTGAEARYYAVTDNLGSVTAVTDASGRTVWESGYLPFGTLAAAEGELGFGGMYAGKDVDAETGLTYHWNRWRSEDGSGFISEDPARDGLNWYDYCGQNPMNATDPTGLSTTRDDWAYQQRTNAKTDDDRQAADELEDEAARDNQGYSDFGNDNSNDHTSKYSHLPRPKKQPDGKHDQEKMPWWKQVVHFGPFGWSHYAPQRIFGYNNIWDAISYLFVGFFIDGTRLDMGNYTLRLWKGH